MDSESLLDLEGPFALYFLLKDNKRAYVTPMIPKKSKPRKCTLVAIKKEKAASEDYRFFLVSI